MTDLRVKRPAAPLPCPHCGATVARLEIVDDVGVWQWSRCQACGGAWDNQEPQPSLFDIPVKEIA